MNKLKRLAELWSHVDSNMDYVEIIERCADETLKRVDPMMRKPVTARATAAVARYVERNTSTSAPLTPETEFVVGQPAKRPTYYPVEVERIIWSRANSCCEFVDPKTKDVVQRDSCYRSTTKFLFGPAGATTLGTCSYSVPFIIGSNTVKRLTRRLFPREGLPTYEDKKSRPSQTF